MDSKTFEWIASIAPEYQVGDYVYIKTDPEQTRAIITGILFREKAVTYEVKRDDHISYMYEIELSKDKTPE